MIRVHYTKLKGIWYGAAVEDKQVVATCFSVEEPELNRLLGRLPQDARFQVLDEPDQLLADVLRALEEIFNGKDREAYGFKTSMDHLSGYAMKALKCTSMVPVGYVTSYGAIARAVGGSARAVGRVEASNPFPLLIPCHRVVRSDLSIGGYGYGQQVKGDILQREERGYEESKRLKLDDGELALFPAEWVNKETEK